MFNITDKRSQQGDADQETHIVHIIAMMNNEINKNATRTDSGVDDRHAPELLQLIAKEAVCKLQTSGTWT